MSEVNINELDKKVAVNENAVDLLTKQHGVLMDMQETQGHRLNSIDLTLKGIEKDNEAYRRDFLALKKEHSEHDKDSVKYRDKINNNGTDLNNLGEKQRNQDKWNLVVIITVLGAVLKIAIFGV